MSTAKTFPVPLSGAGPWSVTLPTGSQVTGAHYLPAPAEQVLLVANGDHSGAPLQHSLYVVSDDGAIPGGASFLGSYLHRGAVKQIWLLMMLVVVLASLRSAGAAEEDCRTKGCPAGQTCQAFERTLTSSRGQPDVTVTVYKCAKPAP